MALRRGLVVGSGGRLEALVGVGTLVVQTAELSMVVSTIGERETHCFVVTAVVGEVDA